MEKGGNDCGINPDADLVSKAAGTGADILKRMSDQDKRCGKLALEGGLTREWEKYAEKRGLLPRPKNLRP